MSDDVKSGNRSREGTVADPSEAESPAKRNWSDDEEVALRLWIALARCYLTFARAVSSKVTEYGLTPAQLGVMEALHHLGPLSLGDLAGKLLVTGGNVTYVMDRLEEAGYVKRQRSGEDRRVVRATLTEKGRTLVEEVFPEHVVFIDQLVDTLTVQEQQQLRGLLKKLGQGILDG